MTLPRRQVVLCSLGAVWIVAALAMWLAWPRNSIEGTWESIPDPSNPVFRMKFSAGGDFSIAFNSRTLVRSNQWSKRSGPVLCTRDADLRAPFQFKLLPPGTENPGHWFPIEGDVYWISDRMFFVHDGDRLLQNQGMVLERVTPLTQLKRWFRKQIGES